jgi:hypothetical protein
MVCLQSTVLTIKETFPFAGLPQTLLGPFISLLACTMGGAVAGSCLPQQFC